MAQSALPKRGKREVYEQVEEKLKLLKLLADETRIEILNILMREDSYVEKLACDQIGRASCRERV